MILFRFDKPILILYFLSYNNKGGVLGHKLGLGVQAKDKTEIVLYEPGYIANNHLPDITGYDKS